VTESWALSKVPDASHNTLNPCLQTGVNHVGSLEAQGAFGSEAENISLTNHTILFVAVGAMKTHGTGEAENISARRLAVPVFAAPLSSASGFSNRVPDAKSKTETQSL